MEEQKEKTVKAMHSEAERPNKMSYEQLENVAHQLSEQAKKLYAELQNANMSNLFKRLDYLFKVIENQHMFSQSFVDKCVTEIEDIITVPEDNSDNKE
jgi:hypothetical protein